MPLPAGKGGQASAKAYHRAEARSTYTGQSASSAHAKGSPASNVLENDISFYCSSRLLDPSVRGKARVTPKRRRRDPRKKIGRQIPFRARVCTISWSSWVPSSAAGLSGSRSAFCFGVGLAREEFNGRGLDSHRGLWSPRRSLSADLRRCVGRSFWWLVVILK